MMNQGPEEPAGLGTLLQATAASDMGAQLYPIPPMKHLSLEQSLALGASERRALLRDCGLGIDSLNWLSGVSRRPLGTRASVSTQSRLHRIHAEVMNDVEGAAVSWCGVGSLISSQSATAKLMRGRGVYSLPANAGMVSLNPKILSVPTSLGGAPPVLSVAPEAECDLLRNFETRMLRDRQEVTLINQQLGEPKYYVDPALASKRRYSMFIHKLRKVGLVSFSRSCRCRIGVFAVAKKNGTQRLILDCRPANRLFVAPPGVDLLTGEGLARLEIDLDCDFSIAEALEYLRLALGVADVSDCFHRLRFGDELKELKKFFAYPPLLASELGITELDGEKVAPETLLYPLAESLPMGWSWSLFFAQAINSYQLARSLVGVKPLVMSDRGLPLVFRPGQPGITVGSYVYVDNLGVMSDDPALVSREIQGVQKHFNGLGLDIHELEVNDVLGVALGIAVHVGEFETRTEHHRWWTLKVALTALLQRQKVAGWEVELYLGHMTFVGLMSREVLSCFHTVYRFIQSAYWTREPLWPSVRAELVGFLGLMIFLRSSWTRSWLPMVYQTDASPSGFGVATSWWSRARVADVGRVLERRRYKLGASQAREHAAAAAGFSLDVVTGLITSDEPEAGKDHRWEVDPSFPEVPADMLNAEHWKLVLADRWLRDDGILILEARAVLKAALRVAHSTHGRHCHVVILVDNMSVVLAMSRFRSKDYKLLVMIRRLASISLARDIKFHLRWIPSEFNYSDEGSRRYDAVIDRSKDLTALVGKLLPRARGDDVDSRALIEAAKVPDARADSGVSTTAPTSSESASGEDNSTSAEPEASVPDAPGLRGDQEVAGGRRADAAGPAVGQAARPVMGARHGCLPLPEPPSRGPDRRARQLRLKRGQRHFFRRAAGEDKVEDSSPASGAADPSALRMRPGRLALRLHELLGKSRGDAEDREEVSGCGCGVEVVGRGRGADSGQCVADRPRPRAVLQPPLLCRGEPLARRGPPGWHAPHAAKPRQARDEQPAAHFAEPPGLEAPLPQQDKDSFQLGRLVCSGGGAGESWNGANGDWCASRSRLLPATVGAFVAHGVEPCPTVSRGRGKLVSLFASLFPRGDVEGGRVGRDHHAQLPANRLPQASASAPVVRQARFAPVALRLWDALPEVGRDREGARHHPGAIHHAALRGNDRPRRGSPLGGGGPEEGPMEAAVQHAPLREGGKTRRQLAAAPAGGAAALPANGSKDSRVCDRRRRAPKVASRPEQLKGARQGAVVCSRRRGDDRGEFLDIFSGVGHVATHARAVGLTATEFEIRHGEQGDVLRTAVQARIRGKVRQRRVAGVMLATPCTSFTTARNRTRGPIRSKKRPRGLTHYAWGERFREVDRRALRVGNQCLDATIDVFDECVRSNTPACLEQPRNSYMWHDRRLRHVLGRGRVIYVDVDQCAFGRPWKKTTRLAFTCCHDADFGRLMSARCAGKGGWCSYNKAYHVQLSGDPRVVRVAPAKQAQAYPERLAKAIVFTLTSRLRSEKSHSAFRGVLR